MSKRKTYKGYRIEAVQAGRGWRGRVLAGDEVILATLRVFTSAALAAAAAKALVR